SPRWGRLANEGARPQRLLWASTSTKNPGAPDVLYVTALAAPFTINTMPEATLLAYADHGQAPTLMPAGGGDAEQTLTAFAEAGIDHRALAGQLQRDGAESFDRSWQSLLASIAAKHQQLTASGPS
ncbi:MAG: transaldolase family protein, partial [Streptosporangiaceae bacterium]